MTKCSYESLFQDGSLWFADSDSVDKANNVTQNQQHLIQDRLPTHGNASSRQMKYSCIPFLLSEINQDVCSTTANNENSGGLRTGAIHEFLYDKVDIFSAPPVSFCLQTATQALIVTGRRLVIWISSQDLWPSPFIVRMNRSRYIQQNIQHNIPELLGTPYMFITTRSSAESFSLLQLALRSTCVASVIAPSPRITFKQSQSLSMAAKSGGVLGIFFSSTQYHNSYYSRWHIKPKVSDNPSQGATISLLRKKGFQTKVRSWDFSQQHFVNTRRNSFSTTIKSEIKKND